MRIQVPVLSSKAQMKIQQMAFMLVAVMIFFGMVALVYFSISIANTRSNASQLRDEEARETVRQIASTPEMVFTGSSDCAQCIDLDKAFFISQQQEIYRELWNIDYLMIEIVHPNGFVTDGEKECTSITYPNADCNKLIVIGGPEYATKTTFVALARWDRELNDGRGGWRYQFGKVHASPRGLQ